MSLLEEIIKSSNVPETCQKEDQEHIQKALEQCKLAKKFDLLGQLENAIAHARKASKIMDDLHILRKETYPEYQVLLAGFYFKVGDSLCNYVECNTDEMNQLKPLEVPEDEEEVDDDAQEEEAQEEEEKDEEENQIDSSTAKPKEEDEKEDISQP